MTDPTILITFQGRELRLSRPSVLQFDLARALNTQSMIAGFLSRYKSAEDRARTEAGDSEEAIQEMEDAITLATKTGVSLDKRLRFYLDAIAPTCADAKDLLAGLDKLVGAAQQQALSGVLHQVITALTGGDTAVKN